MEREALKLALEALDIAQGMLAYLRSQHQPKMLNAYTATKEALAQPEQEPVCDKDPQGCWNVRCQLGKQCKNLAQPAQERNFCSRCGKRTPDTTAVHTCTPPQGDA